MVADLITNRIRVHMGDHFVTWVGGSRFCPVDAKGEKDAEKVKTILKPVYDLSIGGPIEDVGFKVDYSDDKNTDFNHFMMFYMGRVKRLPIKMPDWARGMLAMEDAVVGNANINENSVVTYTSDECFRSYTFHRLPLSGLDANGGDTKGDSHSRARGISGSDLVNGEYVFKVIEDNWTNDVDGDSTAAGGGSSSPGTSQAMGDIPRHLGYFAE